MTNTATLSPKSRLLLEPAIRAKIKDTKRALVAFEVFLIENEDAMYPAQAIARMSQQITLVDAKCIAGLVQSIQALSHPGALNVAQVLKNQAAVQFEPCRAKLIELMDASVGLLRGYRADAQKEEADFFTRNGLPVEATSVSKRVNGSISELELILNEYRNPGSASPLPSPEGTPLTWFNVTDIAEAI